MHHPSESGHVAVFDPSTLSQRHADAELGYQLQAPPGYADIVAMPSVRVVVIEDRLDGFRGLGDGPFVGDVDPVIGVGGDEIDARTTKGAITASEYSASASSPTVIAASGYASINARIV
jgi:hypothetical protein